MIDSPAFNDRPGPMDTLQTVMNAVPSPVFVIDKQAHVEIVNKCAQGQRNLLQAYTHRERMGNIMGCINALSCSDGCGGSRNCSDCPIRKAVGDAVAGKSVFRNQAVFQLLVDGEYVPIHIWVTASLLRYDGHDLIALILEDVAEMVQQTGLIPVCRICGKVGGRLDCHESIEAYVHGRFESDNKSCLCDDCRAASS